MSAVERLRAVLRQALDDARIADHDALSGREARDEESDAVYEAYVEVRGLLAEQAGTMDEASIAELEALVAGFVGEVGRLPSNIRDAHERYVDSVQWLKHSQLSRARGRKCVALFLAEASADILADVRFRAAKHRNRDACDCRLRIAFGRCDRPDSPRLRSIENLGGAGVHESGEYLCESCGTTWRTKEVAIDFVSTYEEWRTGSGSDGR